MQISFPADLPEYRARDWTIAFTALVDNVRVPCAITAEALEDHFGAPSIGERDLTDAFERHRTEIERAARWMLEAVGGRPVVLHSGLFRFERCRS
ncbi:hypothetical protein WS67_17700 [Burkholderia singularis]|uniref:Uncharacterized protein n=1 Tax=Burkholderia singularis TaxID=1503053 RepID=A0A124P8L1_9BURK|nr:MULTISPECIES: DUF1488 domain-containing protein [Burkholderia]AOK32303.1 hypothetical protein AQ611_22970 [Burkholderia sp. Bp7605]KVE25733.1 hypothetical protein WS67_17700 [Burkholderia singularis]SMF99937.1 hypothetical protein BSIN_3125 [Burkholderia singularis]